MRRWGRGGVSYGEQAGVASRDARAHERRAGQAREARMGEWHGRRGMVWRR